MIQRNDPSTQPDTTGGETLPPDLGSHDPTATIAPTRSAVLRELAARLSGDEVSTLDPQVGELPGTATATRPPVGRGPSDLDDAATRPPVGAGPGDTAAPGGGSSRSVQPALPRIALHGEPPEVSLVRLLGEGGMGRVDLAHQRALDRDVAVKRLRTDRSTPAAMAALLEEGRLTGALEHPSIVPIHALGLDENGDPLLVMKRVEGFSWRELIRDPEHPGWVDRPEDRVGRHVEILVQVCNAVHFAHSRGVLHRDLKTENVMVGSFGEVYVLDWGIAIRRDAPPTPAVAGTPAFMAPEMLDGTGRIDVRTDVFLLGAMLVEALTGKPRHPGQTTREVLEAVRRCDPPALGPDVPDELALLCARATARDPDERPEDVPAFQRALLAYQRHRGSVALSDLASRTRDQLELVVATLRDLQARGAEPAEQDRQRAEVRRLTAETRFGYRQALRDWPENVPAARGLDATLRIALAFELDERNEHGATALLAELTSPPPELVARLDALRAERDREQRAQAELTQMRHDQSAKVAQALRSWVMFGVHGAAGLVWVGVARWGFQITHLGIMGFGVALLVVLLGSFGLFRSTLLANQFNRQVLFALVAFCAFTVVQASLGIVRDVPVDHLAWGSYLGISLMFGVMAATMAPELGLLVPPTLVAAVYCALKPEKVTESLALFNFGCAVTWLAPLAWTWVRERLGR